MFPLWIYIGLPGSKSAGVTTILSLPLSKTVGAHTIQPIEWGTQSEIQRKTQVPEDGYEITERKKKCRNILLLVRYSIT